jgi:carboxypeptidase C (cathepsin A)
MTTTENTEDEAKAPIAGTAAAAPQAAPPAPIEERTSVTHHKGTFGDRVLAYTATAGTHIIKDAEGKAKASIFYVAYGRDDVDDPATRPITFIFNGGPGSSSVWLHLGVFGPKRVRVADDLRPAAPPFPLIDNAYSLLPESDLVFIDPVSTGYSRPAPGEDAKQFHGVDEDVETVGEFIRLFTTRAHRWASPKYLAGESYGTTRAAALAGHLQDRHGMYFNGVMLISAVLNFGTTSYGHGNDIAYALYLPSLAAIAWYHGRLGKQFDDVDALVAEVEEFALGDYISVLVRGSRASDKERAKVAAALARYTGLSRDFVEQCNLRIAPPRFGKELLRDERRTVGRLDARYTGSDPDAAGEYSQYDPSYPAIQGPYTAAMNAYLRDHLDFKDDAAYEILNGQAVHPWKLGDKAEGRYLDVSPTLRDAMTMNHALRVFVGGSYYDLATPYFATEWTLDQMTLDPSLRKNIVVSRYQSGHMMYIHEPELVRLHADLSAFVTAPTPG